MRHWGSLWAARPSPVESEVIGCVAYTSASCPIFLVQEGAQVFERLACLAPPAGAPQILLICSWCLPCVPRALQTRGQRGGRVDASIALGLNPVLNSASKTPADVASPAGPLSFSYSYPFHSVWTLSFLPQPGSHAGLTLLSGSSPTRSPWAGAAVPPSRYSHCWLLCLPRPL